MKTALLPVVLLVSSLTPVFAITDAEITPTALVGKTLTFTIDTAGGAFANTGSWTGTFGSSAFTVTNVAGNTVNITTTHSTTLDVFTIVTLPVYVQGSGTTTISLYTSSGIGRYEMNFSPVDSAYQIGTFTLGSTVVPGSEISLQQPVGTELTDGSSKKSFGKVKIGKSSAAKTFTIKNTGNATLTGLAISKSGANSGDFSTSAVAKTSLAPGASMTFKATFKPKTKGAKTAVIKIKSNDKDESVFDIPVTGSGVK